MSDEVVFLTIAEAADMLRVSPDLVRDLIARHELPCATFGRRKLVPRRALDLIVERSLDGFEPDALLVTLAGAVGSSSSCSVARVEGPSGLAEALTPSPPPLSMGESGDGIRRGPRPAHPRR